MQQIIKVMSSSSKQDYLYSLLSRSRYAQKHNYSTENFLHKERTPKNHIEDFADHYDLDKESEASTYDSSQRTKLYNTSYSDTNILRYQKYRLTSKGDYNEEKARPERLRLSGSNTSFLNSDRKNPFWHQSKTPREKRTVEPYLETYLRQYRQLDFSKKTNRKYSDKIRHEQNHHFKPFEREDRTNVCQYSSHRQSRDIPYECSPQPTAYEFLEKSDSTPMFLQKKLFSVDSPKISESLSKKTIKLRSSKEVSIEDFALGQSIGHGNFAQVFIARLRTNGTLYALKRISKQQIKKNKMESQLAMEIKLQLFIHHPNILKLYHFFDDQKYIYLVMEYMEQGSLFDCMKKKSDKMSERETAQILIEIANALTYLHDHDIVHRDIKPQNIVLSHGVRKLCDFGWATVCNDRRSTYCGTFDYAAPEILQGRDYDLKVDLWCLGILTYELLVAKVPFHDESRKETIRKIVNSDKEGAIIPKQVSAKCRNFIQCLLRKRPQQRLTADDLHCHPYLSAYLPREGLSK